MSKNVLVAGNEDHETYQVTLPVKQSDFGDFLKKLIRPKRKLKFRHRDGLVVDAPFLKNLDQLIRERVSSQNGGELFELVAKVNFSDGQTYEESSVERLLSIAPLDSASTAFLSLNYVFLIRFPNEQAPTRHSIELEFADNGEEIELVVGKRFERRRPTSCEMTIEYSQRTWAEDISSLIRRRLEAANKPDDMIVSGPACLRHLAHEGFQFAGSIVILLLFSVFCFYLFGEKSVVLTATTDFSPMNLAETLERINKSLSPLVAVTTSLGFVALCFALVVAFVSSCNFFSKVANIPTVLFNVFETDLQKIAKLKKGRVRRMFVNCFAFALSIAGSVIAAYIFEFLFSL